MQIGRDGLRAAAAVAVALAALAALATPASAAIFVYDQSTPRGYGFWAGEVGRWVAEDVSLPMGTADTSLSTGSLAILSRVIVGVATLDPTRLEIGIFEGHRDSSGESSMGKPVAILKAGWINPGRQVVNLSVVERRIALRPTMWIGVRFLDTAYAAFLNAAGEQGALAADSVGLKPTSSTDVGRVFVSGVGYVGSDVIRADTGLALGLEANVPDTVPGPGGLAVIGATAAMLAGRRRRG